jgi:hypothetical protein
VDPETDGSDDSCGWSSPKPTKTQREALRFFANSEAREPYYLAFRGKQIESPAEAETLLRQAFYAVGQRLFNWQTAGRAVTFAEASEWACAMLGDHTDNFRSSLAFLPGWHSNFDEDRPSDREYCAARLFDSIARYILRERRRWYQHPRWHFWHWSIRVIPLQNFKRWAFSRCEYCGRGFGWNESVYTDQWDSDGPRWFRSERRVHHVGCDRVRTPVSSPNPTLS